MEMATLVTVHTGRNHVGPTASKILDPWSERSHQKVLVQVRYLEKIHGTAGKQLMADLPKCSVLPDNPPFTRVGVDYFGPFLVKRGRGQTKRYGVIFTCLAIRAVHLEVASLLDTDACLNAIRRFLARRGQVKEMYSDNGTNFRSADSELKKSIKEWNTSEITKKLQQKGVQWLFNPPAGSHHGVSWGAANPLGEKDSEHHSEGTNFACRLSREKYIGEIIVKIATPSKLPRPLKHSLLVTLQYLSVIVLDFLQGKNCG